MIAPNIAKPTRKPIALVDREDRVAEQPQRDDRLLGAQLDEHEQPRRAASAADQQRSSPRSSPSRGRAGPGGVEQDRADRRPRSSPRRGSRWCGRGGRAGSCSAHDGDDQRDDADRDVDVEDPAPAGAVGEQAAEHGAEHAGRAEDGAEVALVAAALARRDDVADGGERERHQAAAAEALDGAEGDQLLDVLREPGRAASRSGR